MKVTRVISEYEMVGDEILSEVSISHIPLHELKSILLPGEDDPDLYKIYPLDPSQRRAFLSFLPQLKEFDFEKVELYYECFEG